MRRRGLIFALLALVPATASARDVAVCAALYRQLNNAPQVIGNTAEMRRYAQHLSHLNQDIRSLRIDMRRTRCGGSVVVFGRAGEACSEMQDALRAMEQERAAITAERETARQSWRRSDERAAVLAALRSNDCVPSDLEEARKEELRVQGIELPKEEPQSGIVDLRTKTPKASEAAVRTPPPERPYDPDKKVRMVGPRFLPDESIDLANPKSAGPQPQQ